MRKFAGSFLVFIGVLSLVFAIVAAFYTSGQVKKAPLDTDSETRLTGTASLNGEADEPVKALSLTRADSSKSTSDVVVYNSSACLVIVKGETPDCVEATDPQGRLLSAGNAIFATDRRTGEAVNDATILPPDAEEREGLVNKFPFDTEKKDYTFWDGLTQKAQPATYVGTTDIEGLETYEFDVDVTDAPIQIAEGVPGTYTSAKKLWIDPRTGSIIKQTEQQQRVTDDGSPVLAVDIAFTDDQVTENVESAQDSISQLDLVSRTIPIAGSILGVLLLAAGLFLQLRGRRGTRAEPVGASPEK